MALNQDPDILDPTLSRTYVGRIIFSQMCEKLYEIDEGLQHPAAARRRPAGGQRRRQDRHHQAAARREVQRRHAHDRGGHEVLARPAPRDEGLQPPERAGVGHRGRGRRSAHGAAAAQGAVLAAHRPARRPGRHADLAGGRQEARRQVRHRARVRGPVAVRRARGPGPDRGRALAPLLRPGGGEVRPDRLPHHPRRQRPPGQPALGRHRRHAPGGAHRRRQPQEGRPLRGLQRHRPRLQLDHASTCTTRPARRTRPAISARRWPTIRACARRSSCRSTARRSTRSPTTGQNTVGCGPISPNSVFFDKTRKCPTRDVARAKKLLADAGLASGYKFEMVIVNNPQQRRVGEVIQGMATEAGFDISLRPQSSPPRSRTTTTASTRRS